MFRLVSWVLILLISLSCGLAIAGQSAGKDESRAETDALNQLFEKSPNPVKPVPPPPPKIPELPVIATPQNATENPLPLVNDGELPSVIGKTNLPPNLQIRHVPLPTPRDLPQAAPHTHDLPRPAPSQKGSPMMLLAEEGRPVLVLSSETWQRTPRPEPLLPEMDPEPGVVYILPFISMMVPSEVKERIFDQFVDTLNEQGAKSQLKFVIFKGALDDKSKLWLNARKRITGEIYGYIEDSGCCSTHLRTRISLKYYRAQKMDPLLKYEDAFNKYFDHDQSTLPEERRKFADQIVTRMTSELLKTLNTEKPGNS